MSGKKGMKGHPENLVGRKFGNLTALEIVGSGTRGAIWKCQCSCGEETTAPASKLKEGRKKSCGCLWTKHKDLSDSERLVGVWKQMIQRSRNPKNKDYRYYGAKGVHIREGWLTMHGFVKWALASGYEQGLTIDRADPHGDYTPDNCHWISAIENSRKQTHDIKRGRKPHEEVNQPVPGPLSQTA